MNDRELTPMEYHELTPAEAKIIEKKGTEMPFTGAYQNLFREGLYLCRRCEQPLYQANAKFHSDCGWPSFDEEIPGAIVKKTDADGERTEISCANCAAHLGHVFIGEKLTPKNTRHCVNSLSLKFIPDKFAADEANYAVLGGGCFWCLDSFFREVRGIKNVVAGYGGGQSLHPTYDNIDNHAETVKIIYDPKIITYEQILEIFFSVHNPTTKNRQGNDEGPQYRSIILYATLEQSRVAAAIMKQITVDQIFPQPLVTEVKPLMAFYPAEDYHQNYYCKNPDKGYCQLVINPKLKKFREKFKDLLIKL